MEIYTDGACDNAKTKSGSWSYVIIKNNNIIHELSGFAKQTTSNRMEFTAFIEAVKYLTKHNLDLDESLQVYTDSQLLVNIYNLWINKWKRNNWKRKKDQDIKNLDLVMCLFELKMNNPNINLSWVKGHAGNQWNEYVDFKCSLTLKLNN